jgi:protein-S-isoprenylcysteine O-methyltransferase Ste14
MSALVWVLIAVGVVVVLLVVLFLARRQRSSGLRREFGPEYDRTVDQEGRRSGEADLRQRT